MKARDRRSVRRLSKRVKIGGLYGVLGAIVVAVLVPSLLSMILVGKKKVKQRGVPVQVGGEAGLAIRNGRSAKLIEVPWEGATTMAALFPRKISMWLCRLRTWSRKSCRLSKLTSVSLKTCHWCMAKVREACDQALGSKRMHQDGGSESNGGESGCHP